VATFFKFPNQSCFGQIGHPFRHILDRNTCPVVAILLNRVNVRDSTRKNERSIMAAKKEALWVVLEAKPGKEKDLENFLAGALPLVQAEPATITWYAIRMGPGNFGIFDTFADDAGREAHLQGKVAAALVERASELLAKPPRIEKIGILAAK